MDITKRINLQNIYIFLFLIIFPFGQIIKIGIIQPIDIVIGLIMVYTIVNRLNQPKVFQDFKNFLYIAAFTYVLSIFIFWTKDVLVGFLYLLRLIGYFYFLVYIWNFTKIKENSELLIDALLSISVISAIFGWIQYFWVPSLAPFFPFGWDQHLFRLVGTFLDPTFLGLIIVFGLLIAIHQYMRISTKKYFVLIIFLLISLAFTYSRASYLAFLGGSLMLSFYNNKIKKFILMVLGLSILVLLLPTSRNHSIELLRSLSALARIDNYIETIKVFKTSPVFGVGLNNMCLARQKFIGIESFASHACSGSDSSILFILTTTGILGLFSFIYLAIKTWKESNILFKVLGVSVFIHSLFSNSLFYPWIIGYLIIIFVVDLRSKIEG